MTKFLKKHRTMLTISVLLVLALVFIIVITTVPKDKITQIPHNDERYCYDVIDLLGSDFPSDYLNVTSVMSCDIAVPYDEITVSTNLSAGGKVYNDYSTKDIIYKHARNLFVDVASGELLGKLEIFCLSNVDNENFRQSAIGINIIIEGGVVEINFTKKKFQFRGSNVEDRLPDGLLLQYLVRIK